ncbi:MAG: TDT family transporter [Kurthia sp.]|nr:TDT family transporter [Candidatus Kurthia equi]
MTFIKQIPIPIAGLILAIVSLGNYIIQQNAVVAGSILVWIAIFMMILLLLRVFIDFKAIQHDFKNPMIASVSPTITMALFGIAVYLHSFSHLVIFSNILWYVSILLHLAFITYFTFNFVIKRDLTIQSLYPSWFITYIGIGLIAVTSSTFNVILGDVFLILAMINYVILIPLMLYRIFKTSYNEKPALPLLTILTAPTSLCLAGYITVVENPNPIFVAILLVMSSILYLVALYFLPNIWRLPFYPSFAAFSFPLVITVVAATLANHILHIPYFNLIIVIEFIIAASVTFTVFMRYLIFLIHSTKEEKIPLTEVKSN